MVGAMGGGHQCDRLFLGAGQHRVGGRNRAPVCRGRPPDVRNGRLDYPLLQRGHPLRQTAPGVLVDGDRVSPVWGQRMDGAVTLRPVGGGVGGDGLLHPAAVWLCPPRPGHCLCRGRHGGSTAPPSSPQPAQPGVERRNWLRHCGPTSRNHCLGQDWGVGHVAERLHWHHAIRLFSGLCPAGLSPTAAQLVSHRLWADGPGGAGQRSRRAGHSWSDCAGLFDLPGGMAHPLAGDADRQGRAAVFAPHRALVCGGDCRQWPSLHRLVFWLSQL